MRREEPAVARHQPETACRSGCGKWVSDPKRLAREEEER